MIRKLLAALCVAFLGLGLLAAGEFTAQIAMIVSDSDGDDDVEFVQIKTTDGTKDVGVKKNKQFPKEKTSDKSKAKKNTKEKSLDKGKGKESAKEKKSAKEKSLDKNKKDSAKIKSLDKGKTTDSTKDVKSTDSTKDVIPKDVGASKATISRRPPFGRFADHARA